MGESMTSPSHRPAPLFRISYAALRAPKTGRYTFFFGQYLEMEKRAFLGRQQTSSAPFLLISLLPIMGELVAQGEIFFLSPAEANAPCGI